MKKKTMGGLEQVGTVTVNLVDGSTRRFPVFLKIGVWCLSAYAPGGKGKPDLHSEGMSVTHTPTGLRAADVRADDPRKAQKLAKFAQMFGRATSRDGVIRKYNALAPSKRRWIKAQVAWLLPKKEGGPPCST